MVLLFFSFISPLKRYSIILVVSTSNKALRTKVEMKDSGGEHAVDCTAVQIEIFAILLPGKA